MSRFASTCWTAARSAFVRCTVPSAGSACRASSFRSAKARRSRPALTSLHFPKRSGQIVPTVAPWSSYGGSLGDLSVTRTPSGIVHIRGVVRGGSAGGLASLPKELAPRSNQIFLVNTHGSAARVDVNTDGSIRWIGGSASEGWLSLTGLRYFLP